MLRVHGQSGELFRECRFDAFHLEVRDTYAVPSESEELRRFLNGEPTTVDYSSRPWIQLMRDTTARGVTVRRVRVITVPHSDYHRWLLSITHSNAEAGEDIRYLPRHLAGEVPTDDWWLYDDARVAFNLIDSGGKPDGMAVTSDDGIVAHCLSTRDRLWQSAIPFVDYVDSVRAR
ncbi:DUF6879 family protein [Nocardia sp. NPDC051030]|uniref:DUF6879 family protein n=1 Tax=Nocardia sp. NPDC051030 TaxID=3155162 RepID=UPI0034338C64